MGAEYNLIFTARLNNWKPGFGAPRVLHIPRLHERTQGNPTEPISLSEALGSKLARKVEELLECDHSILRQEAKG
jgi:hypothetical protein